MATDKVAGSTALKDAERLYKEASAILSDAMAEAAAIALVIHEKWGDPLQTVCRRIADEGGMPDAWEALAARSRRLRSKNPRSGEDSSRRRPSRIGYEMNLASPEKKREAIREAIRSDPELAESVYRDSAETLRNQPDRKARIAHTSEVTDGMTRAAAPLEAVAAVRRAHKALQDVEMFVELGMDSDTEHEVRKALDELIDLVSTISARMGSEVLA